LTRYYFFQSNTDNEENILSETETQDTSIITQPTSNNELCVTQPKNKKQRLSNLKNIITELKGITEAVTLQGKMSLRYLEDMLGYKYI